MQNSPPPPLPGGIAALQESEWGRTRADGRADAGRIVASPGPTEQRSPCKPDDPGRANPCGSTPRCSPWRDWARLRLFHGRSHHILHLQKMIARPERCKLRFPTLFGARADGMRISPGNAAAFFCMIEIGLGSHVVFKGPLGTLFEDTIEVIVGNIQPAGLADSGWNVAKQLLHQIAKLGPDFLQCQITAQKTNAAIDIKTDAAGRDNAVLLVDRGNTSNGKAVALMNIRHCKGSADDAGKHRNVGCLFEGLIAADGLEQWLARVHKSVREHSGFIGPWNQPAIIVDLFQVHIKRLRTPGSPNHPGPDDFRIDDTSRL